MQNLGQTDSLTGGNPRNQGAPQQSAAGGASQAAVGLDYLYCSCSSSLPGYGFPGGLPFQATQVVAPGG